MSLTIEVVDALDAVPAEAWDALVGDGCPFLEHAFLVGLERTGAVGPGTGWGPRYLLCRRGRALVGAPRRGPALPQRARRGRPRGGRALRPRLARPPRGL